MRDMITALTCQQPSGRVPIWELEFHLWDQFSNQHLVIGEEFQKLSPAEQEKTVYTNAEIFVSVSERLHFSALTLPGPFWEVGPGVPAYFWLPEKWQTRQAQAVRQMALPDLMLVANCLSVLGMPIGAEYVAFAYQLFDAPEEIDALAQRKLQEGIEAAERFFGAGVEIGITTSDLADNHSTFLNPRQLDRFVWPYLNRWVEALKKLGMYSVLHSDGNLNLCLDQIANSEVDCLQAIDPTAGMNLWDVKQRVGDRLCLAGNVDCELLLCGTPERVYEATCALLNTCKMGGGLILGASNAVQSVVPVENYLALTQAWETCGGY